MTVWVEGFEHRTGEHCASTALRNILGFHGLEMSEAMVVGLAGGLGFFYIRSDATSPTRMFHGRTVSLETDFCANAALPVSSGQETDDGRAWESLKARLDEGLPVMLSTDTFYLEYQNTRSHFPGHRAVAVGYDEDGVWIADRKLGDYQHATREEVRRARNADDYPIRCMNEYHHFRGRLALGRPLAEAIRIALRRNAQSMLGGAELALPTATSGIRGMRELASELPDWKNLSDWSWAARFGYQVVVKRGAGGRFFRSLYRDFLAEAAASVPRLGADALASRMDGIADRWGELAALLEEQSERETCAARLFDEAAAVVAELADREQSFFLDVATLVENDALWKA
jgi:hypothetical protein